MLVLALVGFVVYVITVKVPMPPFWASTIQVLSLLVLVLYVITRFVRLPNLPFQLAG